MCALTFEYRNGLSLHYKFSRAWNCVAYIPAFHTALRIFLRFATQCVANFLVLSTSVLQFPMINTVLHVSCTWHCATSHLNLTLDRRFCCAVNWNATNSSLYTFYLTQLHFILVKLSFLYQTGTALDKALPWWKSNCLWLWSYAS